MIDLLEKQLSVPAIALEACECGGAAALCFRPESNAIRSCSTVVHRRAAIEETLVPSRTYKISSGGGKI